MEKSDSIIKLVSALIKAHKEVSVIRKSALNPFFKSKYADLPAVDAEYKRVFPSHGLAVVQAVEGAGLRTTLLHESGEWISSIANMMPIKNDPQAQGSAITYMRRYSLATICGIVSEEDDDDGHTATQGAVKEERKPINLMAQMAPESHKNISGKISEHEPANAYGFHTFTIDGIKLASKDKKTIEDMTLYYEGGDMVVVAYTETIKGKFTNRYINSVKQTGDVPF